MLETCLKPSALPTDAVLVGHVLGAWGLRGAVKIAPYSADPQALLSCKAWYLLLPPTATAVMQATALEAKTAKRAPITAQSHEKFPEASKAFVASNEVVSCQVNKAHFHGSTLVASLKGLSNCEVAQSLKGTQIYIPRENFPPATEDEYYWVDLIGLSVHNREGLCLGEVKDLLTTGPQAVLVVEPGAKAQPPEEKQPSSPQITHSRKEVLIPFVSAYIDKVDLAAKRISVDWHADD